MKKLTNDMEELKLVINNNLYIKKFKSNTQKNINPLVLIKNKNNTWMSGYTNHKFNLIIGHFIPFSLICTDI